MDNIQIRIMTYDDISFICEADHDESAGFVEYLRNNLDNQENKKCSALLALYGGEVAGYVFLYYECKWGAMGNQGIPGIVDLIVFEPYRRKGVATALMDYAEDEARNIHSKIYLEVCLNSEYGPAQRFYVKRGYVPDGAGVYYEAEVLGINAPCKNDDELTLCLVKEF